MSRLIDADGLKRKVQKEATESWKMKIKASVETILNQVIDWIDEAQTVEPEQQWIPVTERLPIPNERIGNVRKYYLIQNEYGDMMVACYSGEWEQIYRHEYCLDKVVAWMPLPKPYETQESEDKE